jgi:hypothetical protein
VDDQTAQLIINHIDSRIDDLKDTTNQNFNLLVNGMRTLHDKFEAHEKIDTEQFTDIKVSIESSKAVATTKARLWASVSTLAALVIAFLTALWTRH